MPFVRPPEISFSHLPRSEALELAIQRRLTHLSQYGDDLQGCRVVVSQTARHSRQGRPFEVRIDLTVSGRELVASRVRQEDVYVAVRDAFDDMRRQLEDTVRRRRRHADHRVSVRHLALGASDQGAAQQPDGESTLPPAPGGLG